MTVLRSASDDIDGITGDGADIIALVLLNWTLVYSSSSTSICDFSGSIEGGGRFFVFC